MANFINFSAYAKNNLRFQFGEEVSVFSEKAYRKNQGKIFEAVGSVVIISGEDTIYGEKASLNLENKSVRVEGNIRYINKDVTVYGSVIDYNTATGEVNLENARIITSEFTLIAEKLAKKSANEYQALEAEFTTCRDCKESWAIFGKKINIDVGNYVYISHAIFKIKGIDSIYLPYIVLPLKNKRESGLLFPHFFSQNEEGISFAQPVFWAINQSQDMTMTPMTLGERGFGLDLEYRNVFGEKKWFEMRNRSVDDEIYLPYKENKERSGEKFFRNIVDLETHYQKSNDSSFHFKFTDSKDINVLNDFSDYVEPLLQGSDIGAEGFFNTRTSLFSFGIESGYKKNLFYSDPTHEDKSYVQILPSFSGSLIPVSLIQNKYGIKNLSFNFNSDITVFKQQERNENIYLRNAVRQNLKPALNWQIFTKGPFSLNTNYELDYQKYDFDNKDEKSFQKAAGVLQTEFSFVVSKVFGLAYRREIESKKLSLEEAKSLHLTKNKKDDQKSNLVGEIPSFEEALTQDKIFIEKNSYRLSQEFKFIHHYITADHISGNERFYDQIKNADGWFDYDDAIMREISLVGSNITKTDIPKVNTLEFNWNNSLVKKSPKAFSAFDDGRYLRDNFSYSKVAFFNISQGYLLDSGKDVPRNSFVSRLTRLYSNMGFNVGSLKISMSDYYFYQSGDQIVDFNFQKQFDRLSLLGNYNFNSVPESSLRIAKAGIGFKPSDILGFSILKEHDLHIDKNIRTIYQVDFMPDNNCWILNLNYRDSVIDKRFSFHFVFNFGDENFSSYRTNYFSVNRLD